VASHIFEVGSICAAFFCLVLGLFAYFKNPHQPANRTFFFFNLTLAIWNLGDLSAFFPFPLALYVYRTSYGVGSFIAYCFLIFMCSIVEYQPRYLKRLVLGASACFSLLSWTPLMIQSIQINWNDRMPITETEGPVYPLFIVFFLVVIAYSLYPVIQKHKTAVLQKRTQLQYVMVAICFGLVGILFFAGSQLSPAIPPIHSIFQIAVSLCFATAILKHRLLDLQLILRRTLVYSVVSIVLTALYFFGVSLMAGWSATHMRGHSLLSSAMISGFITIVFFPLFRWTHYAVDKLFFRFRIDRDAKLMEFSAEVVRSGDISAMTRSLYRVVEEALHPKQITLYLRHAGEPAYVLVPHQRTSDFPEKFPLDNVWTRHFRSRPDPALASDATLPGEIRQAMTGGAISIVVPILIRQDLLGFLLLGEKRSEESYTSEDRVLLQVILNQAALAYEKPKLLKEMTSGMAHEIKMPLANITLPAELTFMDISQLTETEMPDALREKITRRMKYIMDQAFLASRRVDALQAVSGENQDAFHEVRLESVIQESVETLKTLSADKKCPIRCDVENNLPFVRGEPQQLQIALVNLLKNGIEAATSQTKRAPFVEIKVSVKSQGIDIWIRDNGPGISLDHELSIFEPYFTTKGAQGTGIGLHLSRQIAEQHGGFIELVKDSPDITCFRFHLPALL